MGVNKCGRCGEVWDKHSCHYLHSSERFKRGQVCDITEVVGSRPPPVYLCPPCPPRPTPAPPPAPPPLPPPPVLLLLLGARYWTIKRLQGMTTVQLDSVVYCFCKLQNRHMPARVFHGLQFKFVQVRGCGPLLAQVGARSPPRLQG